MDDSAVTGHEDKGGIAGIDIDNAGGKPDLQEPIMRHLPIKFQITSA